MISGSNQQLQQQLEYTLLKPDYHSRWISKVQSGREDTLEERYAIKFCFKLGKNATETYRMLQTAFRPSCMNQVSFFEWHNRFREGRESVRGDERCGRSKEVRTPELIGQIKNFMDKDRRVSIETISALFDVSVGTGHTIIREKLKMRKICAKFVPRVLREDQKERRHDSREMVELINSDPKVLDALVTTMKAGSTAMTQRPRDNWGDERGCDKGHWNAHTRGLPWDLPEVVGTVQVHCSRRRLLQRGLEFHVCTINKSAHTKKVWKLN